MPTAPTPITTLPTPVPQTSDPTDFDTRADLFLTALPNFGDQQNALGSVTYANALEVFSSATDIAAAAAVSAASTQFFATSSSDNLTVAAGTLDIHFDAPKTGFAVSDQVVVVLRSDTTIKMFGAVASVISSSHITVTVISSGVFGSGTYAGWDILSAAFLTAGATAAQMWAQVSDAVAVTPKGMKDSNALIALTYASTVAINLLNGRRFSLIASASFTLGTPSNCSPGDVIEIFVTNTAGSIVLATTGVWKRQNGLFVMDATNAHVNKIIGVVETVDGSGNATFITYDGKRNPS